MKLVKTTDELLYEIKYGTDKAAEAQRRNKEFVDELVARGREKHPMLLTVGEVMHRCKVNRKQIDAWVKSRQLPCTFTPGGHRRFRPEDVEILVRHIVSL